MRATSERPSVPAAPQYHRRAALRWRRHLSVEVELEVEWPAALAAAGEAVKALLERVEAATRLRLRVQRILPVVELAPLFCRTSQGEVR